MPDFKLTQFDKIHYYEDVFDKPYEIIGLIEALDSEMNTSTKLSKWNDWMTSGGQPYQFGMQKRVNDRYVPGSNVIIENLLKHLESRITDVSRNYESIHNIDIGDLMPLSISKYFEGKEMGPHCDNYEGTKSGPVISVVGYLNDDYDGGELYFREQDLKIKPTAGSVVIFPSNEPYFHQSMPTKSGVKYMCPGFWYKR